MQCQVHLRHKVAGRREGKENGPLSDLASNLDLTLAVNDTITSSATFFSSFTAFSTALHPPNDLLASSSISPNSSCVRFLLVSPEPSESVPTAPDPSNSPRRWTTSRSSSIGLGAATVLSSGRSISANRTWSRSWWEDGSSRARLAIRSSAPACGVEAVANLQTSKGTRQRGSDPNRPGGQSCTLSRQERRKGGDG